MKEAGEKLFYSIGEAAELLGVKPHVLRYWESEFEKLRPKKTPTGQRVYRLRDLQVAKTIHRLLYDEKYTIAGARKKLEEMNPDDFDQLSLFEPSSAQLLPLEERAQAFARDLQEAREILRKTLERLEPYASS